MSLRKKKKQAFNIYKIHAGSLVGKKQNRCGTFD